MDIEDDSEELELKSSYPLLKMIGLDEFLLPLVLKTKDGFMQNNSTSHKSCGVYPVLSLASLMFSIDEATPTEGGFYVEVDE